MYDVFDTLVAERPVEAATEGQVELTELLRVLVGSAGHAMATAALVAVDGMDPDALREVVVGAELLRRALDATQAHALAELVRTDVTDRTDGTFDPNAELARNRLRLSPSTEFMGLRGELVGEHALVVRDTIEALADELFLAYTRDHTHNPELAVPGRLRPRRLPLAPTRRRRPALRRQRRRHRARQPRHARRPRTLHTSPRTPPTTRARHTRRRLHTPRLRPTSPTLRRPPHHPLAPRRQNRPVQPCAHLQAPPPRRTPSRMATHPPPDRLDPMAHPRRHHVLGPTPPAATPQLRPTRRRTAHPPLG